MSFTSELDANTFFLDTCTCNYHYLPIQIGMHRNSKKNVFDGVEDFMMQFPVSHQEKVGQENQTGLTEHGTNLTHFMSVEQRR